MIHPTKKRILDIYGHEPNTMDDLAYCVIAVANKCQYTGSSKKAVKTPRVVGFSWSINHTDRVSNTHSSPMDGVQNWGCKDGIPKGYPGWTGRVWIRYEHNPPGFGSDMLSQTLTYTGTGGAGGYNGPWEKISLARYKKYGLRRDRGYPEIECYSWDYKIFDSDWPLIANWLEKQRVLKYLGKNNEFTSHNFLWEDEATRNADSQFMSEVAN